MSTTRKWSGAGKALLVMSILSTLVASASERTRALPRISLADPRGVAHRLDALAAERPLILIVTAPIADTERDQRGWDEALEATRPREATARVVFLEDLSQSWFPGIARRAMRDAFDPAGTLVLIDEDGGARRALAVEEGTTVVLVYEGGGRFVASYVDGPTREAVARAWKQVGPATPRR